MKIVYRFKDAGQLAAKQSCLPNEQREYFDRQSGYIDLSALGILDVEMKAGFISKYKGSDKRNFESTAKRHQMDSQVLAQSVVSHS